VPLDRVSVWRDQTTFYGLAARPLRPPESRSPG